MCHRMPERMAMVSRGGWRAFEKDGTSGELMSVGLIYPVAGTIVLHSTPKSKFQRLIAEGKFAHDGEEISFGVVEVGHPQFVGGHAGDQVRGVFKFDAGGLQARERGGDVGNLEVQQGSGMVELRLFGGTEHQAHAAAIEKAELARAEERLESENIAVEGGRAIDVVDVDGDLHEAGEDGAFWNGQDGLRDRDGLVSSSVTENLGPNCGGIF
jgi:hypothetical protein